MPLERYSPTAVHEVGVTHDTWLRALSFAPALGLEFSVHVVPFQDSMSVRNALPFEETPLALHELVDTHDTLVRRSPSGPAFALETRPQVVPFQETISVRASPLVT